MRHETLIAMLETLVATRPDDVAVVAGDAEVTYAGLRDRARTTASALAASGVGAGDRVAFVDKNSLEFFDVAFGAAYLDAAIVPVNWRLGSSEVAFIVGDSRARVVVVHDDFAEMAAEIVAAAGEATVVMVGGEGGDALPAGTVAHDSWLADAPPVPATGGHDPDAVCIQLYTSGTTGRPKGAMLTNRNLAIQHVTAESFSTPPSRDSVVLVAMPIFHVGGAGWAAIAMGTGARLVLLRDIDPVELLALIDRHRVTHAFLVPTALQFLQLMPTDGLDLSSIEAMVYGASPMSRAILEGSMAQFGCDFSQLYGLTETTGGITELAPADHDLSDGGADHLSSAGRPFPTVEIRIAPVDENGEPDLGVIAGEGEVGEIQVRGEMVMAGYWMRPEESAAALTADGWFRTGDLGELRDGYLYVRDRLKDMIISGGENIYPAEVENVVMSHPSVADCAVIAVPHETWGETPRALVVAADPDAGVDAEAVIAFCRDNLAHFKCPTSVEVVGSIPRNALGKILKRELRRPYWESHERS